MRRSRYMIEIREHAFETCRATFPQWRELSMDQVTFAAPKGFSSITMAMRTSAPVSPSAVLYRRLEGKDNAILDFETEKSTFLALAEAGVATQCHHYDRVCRLEAFYEGRSLVAQDLLESTTLEKIADELWRLHHLEPDELPQESFFELLHAHWGPMARSVLTAELASFPENEREMAVELREIYEDATAAKVLRCLPEGPLHFCHNDTYHGNIMKLDSGEIRLVDFEFSCLNHTAFDFSNLFAETVMVHAQPERPYFRIAEPSYTSEHIETLVESYLANDPLASPARRRAERDRLVADTERMLMLSDYMYAMAALPLAVEPIQKIRFLPYAHQRFRRFKNAWAERYGGC